MFHGSMVALITPMTLDGQIDEVSLRKLVDFHLAEGTDAIIAVGTTGESATLTDEEQLQVIRLVIDQVAGRLPVIAGTGANSTAKTIKLTQAAMDAGADACLVVTPYYNKPTQEGLYQHYKAVANSAAIPIIMYNVPSRTGVDMLPETVARLSTTANIIGIKEASGSVERAQNILKQCGSTLDVYSGEDALALDLILNGAKGVISVTANVAPKLMNEMCQAALDNEKDRAIALNEKLMDLHKVLFLESNPIPAKWVLHRMGMVPEGIRLPLTVLADKFHASLESAVKALGIELKSN